MRYWTQLAERPHIVAIRASFKSLLIESEAQQFSALLIQGGNGANFPRCGDRTKAAHGYVLRGAFESLTIPATEVGSNAEPHLNGFAASCQIASSPQCPCSPV
jgi:hypothetical protein